MPRLFWALIVGLTLASCARGPAPSPTGVIDLDVDATDLPRALLHARETLPVSAGTVWLWFPKWMPGTHAPCGPVENLGGLRISLLDGTAIAWRRDEDDPNRFRCDVPAGHDRLVVAIDYLCNNQSVNSEGIDSFGSAGLGVISWNTCLVYAESTRDGTADAQRVRTRARLPDGWRHVCAISDDASADDAGAGGESAVRLAETSLRELIDAPLICGANLRTVDLSSPRLDVRWDVLAPIGQDVRLDDAVVQSMRQLVLEAQTQFPGPPPFTQYHLLTVLSNEMPATGLEHQSCSLNVMPLADWGGEGPSGEALGQLSHEFCHAWCGKYRRPAGMITGDYHRPERTALLWVYEGLDMYLGEVLAARAGLMDADGFTRDVETFAEEMALQSGRSWRSVEDTAIANWQLRAPCHTWGRLRRDQDYYLEGMLFWMEADAIIRSLSHGARSLDDVCASFFAVTPGTGPRGYGVEDVVAALTLAQPYDWRDLIQRRIMEPAPAPPWSALERCGYRADLVEGEAEADPAARRRSSIDERWSIGMSVARGRVTDVVIGGAADRARIAPGMRIGKVNDQPFNSANMGEALAACRASGGLDLWCDDGRGWRSVRIAYDRGPRRLAIVRREGAPDLLAEMVRARAPSPSANAETTPVPPPQRSVQ